MRKLVDADELKRLISRSSAAPAYVLDLLANMPDALAPLRENVHAELEVALDNLEGSEEPDARGYWSGMSDAYTGLSATIKGPDDDAPATLDEVLAQLKTRMVIARGLDRVEANSAEGLPAAVLSGSIAAWTSAIEALDNIWPTGEAEES